MSKKYELSQHDLFNRYFRKDVLLGHNIDLLRAPDFMMCLVFLYSAAFTFMPQLSLHSEIAVHFVHALLWRFHHSIVLGVYLKRQSNSKFLVRHYLKHYHYSGSNLENARGAVQEAFTNWKAIYNLSMVMTFGEFLFIIIVTTNSICFNSFFHRLCVEDL